MPSFAILLERLKTTVITTNVRVKRGQKTTMFSWIDRWDDLIDAQTKESRIAANRG